jgi:hypothetical protein
MGPSNGAKTIKMIQRSLVLVGLLEFMQLTIPTTVNNSGNKNSNQPNPATIEGAKNPTSMAKHTITTQMLVLFCMY